MNNSCETKCCGNCAGKAAWAIGVLGTTLLMALIVWAMIHYTQPKPAGAEAMQKRIASRKEVQAAGKAALENYGWQDKDRGIARLPVAKAMDIAEKEWQDPKAARALMLERVQKATAPVKSAFE